MVRTHTYLSAKTGELLCTGRRLRPVPFGRPPSSGTCRPGSGLQRMQWSYTMDRGALTMGARGASMPTLSALIKSNENR